MLIATGSGVWLHISKTAIFSNHVRYLIDCVSTSCVYPLRIERIGLIMSSLRRTHESLLPQTMQSMKKHLPVPTFPKARDQMAAEYNMHVRTFMRKLTRSNVEIPSGLIMPGDQMTIYRTLGPPFFIWKDMTTLAPFLKSDD